MVVLLERFYLHNRSHQRISFTNSKVSTTFQDPIIQSSCCKKWYCINIDSDLFFIISKELFAGLEKKYGVTYHPSSSATNVESQSVKTKMAVYIIKFSIVYIDQWRNYSMFKTQVEPLAKRESGVTKRFNVLTSFLWSLRVWDIICCPFVFLPYFNFELKFLTSVSG